MWNRGPLKILNGMKLILDDQGTHLDSYTIGLELPYARYYNPGFVHFLPYFSVQERLILQTIYVHKQGKLGLESAVYNQEPFQIKSGL